MIRLRNTVLPSYLDIKDYLLQIDRNEVYSNRGPLVQSLEKRIASHLNIQSDRVIVLANATLALQIALLCSISAYSINKKKYCLCPSYTFAATPASIVNSGLEPFFVDIDYENGALSTNIIKKKYGTDFKNVAAVMPVSAFGTKLDANEWENFSEKYKLPIIADQAWSFDNYVDLKKNFSVISLHSTKVLGCGEGGILIVPDEDYKNKVVQLSNFGFNVEKISILNGTNAKMSEYSAAVCHAALDGWDRSRKISLKLQKEYIKEISTLKNIKIFKGLTENWCWMSSVIRANNDIIDKIESKTSDHNIETRKWWGKGCHDFPAFRQYKTTCLKNTLSISNEILNLPFHNKLSLADIKTITSVLKVYGN